MKGSTGGSMTFLSKLNNETQCLMPKCKNKPGKSGYCDKCLGGK
jgi:hypothetical protein